MKRDFDEVISESIALKDVSHFGKRIKKIADKYGVHERQIYIRFKSIYGASPREIIKKELTPPREKLEDLILSSESSKEFIEKSELPKCIWQGLFDREFGVSTFQKAKLQILKDNHEPVRKNITREDNVSLLMSQYLGDGSYYRNRHAMRIDHSIKQANYLRWKVALLKEGFPFLPTKITQTVHTQGHEMVQWWSRRLGKIEFPGNKAQAVELLTPIGWLLWWLDDGGWWQDISIACKDEQICRAAVKELETYGISARVVRSQSFVMCGQKQSLLFYQNFIQPYEDLIPLCMRYKFELKI